MKPIILSTFHCVLFFWGILFVNAPKTTGFNKANECDYVSPLATEQTQQAVAAGAHTELLNCEILFKY